MAIEACEDVECVMCEGPPNCPFLGDDAIENAMQGCPRCRRIIVHANGDETSYRKLIQ